MDAPQRFGRYILTRRLAVGGMSEIFLGHHHSVDDSRGNRMVIKRILPSLAQDPSFVGMFITEASLAAQMNHPNIVRVHDFGEFEGQLYIVMEYIDGVDGWRLLRHGPPLIPAVALYIVREVLKGLDHVHGFSDLNERAMGVVHSDVSPSNIYISRLGEVKLGDFGIAKVEHIQGPKRATVPKGKFGYMAPEQVVGEPFDRRADLFGVGVVLGELLIGDKIFSGKSQLAVLLNIRDVRLEPLERRRDLVPAGLYPVLMRALTRSPDDRFPTARAFMDALSEFMAAHGLGPTPGDVSAVVNATLSRLADVLTVKQKSQDDRDTPIAPLNATLPFQAARREQAPDFSKMSTEAFKGLSASYLFEDDIIGGKDDPHGKTPTRPQLTLRLRLPGSDAVEDVTLAHLIESIHTNQVSLNALLSLNNGPFRPLHDIPEIARHLPSHTPTVDVSEPGPPDRRGYIGPDSVAQILLATSDAMETGLLIFDRDKVRKEIYLRQGELVYVTSNLPGELLGEFLVARKILSREQLNIALDLLPKYNGHLGDTLVSLGTLRSVDLFRHIGDQVRTKLLDVFTWPSGEFQFYRGVPCPKVEFPLSIVLEKLVVQGIDEMMTADDLARHLTAIGGELVAPASSLPILKRFPLPEAITGPIEDCTSEIPVREFLASGDRETRPRALLFGLELGRLELVGQRPPWRAAD